MKAGSCVRSILASTALLVALVASREALATTGRCDSEGQDAAAIAAARAAAESACPCAAATSHAEYAACAGAAIAGEVAQGRLSPACRNATRRFANRSVCGRPGAVTCCVTSASGRTRPTIKASADGCRAPRGGSACIGLYDSALDACNASGCRPLCGDGVIEDGEACEPPGSGSCDASCQWIVPGCGNGVIEPYAGEDCDPPAHGTCSELCLFVHTCGNGVIEPGEQCDGQAVCGADCTIPLSKCCSMGGACFGGASDHGGLGDYQLGKSCYLVGGVSSYTQCVPSGGPCPIPEISCVAGSCEDVPIDPIEVCCQHPGGTCTGATASTNQELGSLGCGWFPPPQTGEINRLMLGTCGADGRCVPAS